MRVNSFFAPIGIIALRCDLSMDLIDATAEIMIPGRLGVAKFRKRPHNPLLMASGFDKTDVAIPRLGDKRLPATLDSRWRATRGVYNTQDCWW
jgi:hypothetical protein